VVEHDRHRLGEAEHELSGSQEVQQQRHRHGADRIDMADRVQADAPEQPGGVVAEILGHIAMRGLVQRDGKQHGQA
jgi:hypothetical protein